MIMMMLGLLGEYIGRMYMILSNKPQYSVQKALNVPAAAADALERKDQLVYETLEVKKGALKEAVQMTKTEKEDK